MQSLSLYELNGIVREMIEDNLTDYYWVRAELSEVRISQKCHCFVELVDDTSWAEFMPMGVTKDRFADYKQYYDEDIFAAAGHQIRQLAL